jgi:hypothetical protein
MVMMMMVLMLIGGNRSVFALCARALSAAFEIILTLFCNLNFFYLGRRYGRFSFVGAVILVDKSRQKCWFLTIDKSGSITNYLEHFLLIFKLSTLSSRLSAENSAWTIVLFLL